MESVKKILVIEDDSNTRRNLLEILTLSMYKVFAADSGKKGIEMAISVLPDLILCDFKILLNRLNT